MVFVNEEWNNTGDIVVYSNYHKYWLDKERNIKNPLFGADQVEMFALGKAI